MTKPAAGFTLIEVLITVAIIGILTAIALPSYTYYVQRGKITEATTTLSNLRQAMERDYQNDQKYKQSTCQPAVTVGQPVFAYTCTASAQSFKITARGHSSEGMAGFVYTIDQDGTRETTKLPDASWGSTMTPVNCWVTRKGGQC